MQEVIFKSSKLVFLGFLVLVGLGIWTVSRMGTELTCGFLFLSIVLFVITYISYSSTSLIVGEEKLTVNSGGISTEDKVVPFKSIVKVEVRKHILDLEEVIIVLGENEKDIKFGYTNEGDKICNHINGVLSEYRKKH